MHSAEPQISGEFARLLLLMFTVIIPPLCLGLYFRYGLKKGKLYSGYLLAATFALLGLVGFGLLTIRDSVQSTTVHQDAVVSRTVSSSSSQERLLELIAAGKDESNAPSTSSQIQYITGNSAPISIPELPTWRKIPPHEGSPASGIAKYVLTSQQFATVDEAEANLYLSLATDVQSALIQSRSPASGWMPTPEDLRVSGLITEKVIETIPLKVGEFDASVQRVSWLVEFNPQTNQALHSRWEPSESQRRSKLILSILAGASGLLGLSALALRSRRRNPPTPAEVPATGAA